MVSCIIAKENKLIHSFLGEYTHQENHGSARLDEQITPIKERGKYIKYVGLCKNLPGLVCEESVPEAEDVRKWELLQTKECDFWIFSLVDLFYKSLTTCERRRESQRKAKYCILIPCNEIEMRHYLTKMHQNKWTSELDVLYTSRPVH